jgi:hypothetical protein
MGQIKTNSDARAAFNGHNAGRQLSGHGQSSVVAIDARRIRSSGRTTGSVEITLPPEFFVFMGHECQITGVGGSAPALTLVPSIDGLRCRLEHLWQIVCAGFDLRATALDHSALNYCFSDSHYHDGVLDIGLRDCGFLATPDTVGQLNAHNLRFLTEFCRFVISRFPALNGIQNNIQDETFLAKAIVHIVHGDNPSVGLFEADTILVALAQARTEGFELTGDVTSLERWLCARPLIAALIDHVRSADNKLSSLEDQHKNWARAQRIASKVM